MEKKDFILTISQEDFVAGTEQDLLSTMHHLLKLDGGVISFCQSGWAHVTIDLKDYEITANTQSVLLPGSIVSLNGCSKDFTASYFGFSKKMLMEACLRFSPYFFHFIKDKPCYVLPKENIDSLKSLIHATTAIYHDQENSFRYQIARNHLQSFMLNIYDKCCRYFGKQEIEGGNRQNELFKNFVSLVRDHCTTQREVNFYADRLCISTKYLTGICQSVAKTSAKKIIDDFAILEIKVMLQSTELTIQSIADKFNFPDQSYLGRFFKRHEGISPKEYQSRYIV